jgi:hypothetical protein
MEGIINGGMINMKWMLKKMCIVGVDMIYLVHDNAEWQAAVNIVRKFWAT